MPSAPIIGIDLGTTYSCLAYFEPETRKTVTIPINQKTTIPSFVTYTDEVDEETGPKGDGVLVGHDAKNEAINYIKNTIYDAKRMIGKTYKEVKADANDWPFEVCDDGSGRVAIKVSRETGIELIPPIQISALILEELKRAAETEFPGRQVTDAVITVPAYFNNEQKNATRQAARIAGLTVRRIVSEPTAAAITYGLDHQSDDGGGPRRIFVFDLGGGTFDASLVEVDGMSFRTLATAGDPHLGGCDFDEALMQHCKKEMQIQLPGIRVDDPGVQCRLRAICEEAKVVLSSMAKAKVALPRIFNNKDFKTFVTKQQFEDMCEPLFKRCFDGNKLSIGGINDLFAPKTSYTKESVDHILMVGGSTKIPLIRSMVIEYFDGKEPIRSAGLVDEAVARGAAAVGANLERGFRELGKDEKFTFKDATAHSLGIEVDNSAHGDFDTMSIILPKNSPFPAKAEREYGVSLDHQSVIIEVFEGEHELVQHNHKLGEFMFTEFVMKSGVEVRFTAKMSFNINGLLTVSAVQTGWADGTVLRGEAKEVKTIIKIAGALDEQEVAKMSRKASQSRAIATAKASQSRAIAMTKRR